MKRLALTPILAAVALALFASPAAAAFGLHDFDVTFTNPDGSTATQAGSHPFEFTTSFGVNRTATGFDEAVLDGEVKDLLGEEAPGFVADTTVYPRCSTADFLTGIAQETECPKETAVGVVANAISIAISRDPTEWVGSPVYNLEPPPGVLVRLGFSTVSFRVTIDAGIKQSPPYAAVAALRNVPQVAYVYGTVFKLWGDPSDPAHDPFRGNCYAQVEDLEPGEQFEFEPHPFCTSTDNSVSPRDPFLTLPASCTGPAFFGYEAISWRGDKDTGGVLTRDDFGNPQGFTGCGALDFAPRTESKTTTDEAETGSGFEFNVFFDDEGLTNPTGLAESQAHKAEVTLPEGVTINPSIGEGLGICTPADYDREDLGTVPGEGCPNASKIGTLQARSPLADKTIDGSIYLAQQGDPQTAFKENPFDSLIALYMVFRDPELGIFVKLPLLVEPDPLTGQLVATLEDVPQLPIESFRFRFKEGVRAPLVTPSACGTYTTEAKFYPHADPANPTTVSSSFEIDKGIGGTPCPPGGVPPFHPGFEAGSANNNAGSFSPFVMRLLRADGEQDMTKFSSVLPPGVLGSLSGVSKCPDIAVPTAKSKTGRQELAFPSCPANSLIGRTLAGAGVGSALTYVGGQIYLAGPYKGAPLSVISITPAVAGPFDAGTVVVRLGLDLNPHTAEVEVDGAASDPIPHILKGIVLKVRDLRVYVDRPNFTLNPTSCDESSAKARLFGSFLNVLDPGDDRPVDLATRYQAANCLNLGFDPKLGLKLKGGTRRGGHPGLRAIYTPKKGDANIEDMVVRLPRSAFLDQAHIRTICTRVQFAAQNCPKAAQYGYIRAWTPLLDEPLQGPVWLRSSNNKLPDLVFDLKGLVDIEVAVRIDSARGGIRASLEDAPDAPLSRVVLNMQGGKKGLIVNSRNLCTRKSRANVKSTGHNSKQATRNPVMRPQCKRRKKAKRSSHGRGARASVAGASSVG